NQPLLAQLKNRALRQRIYEASIGRARGGSSDNTAVIAQLVKLRAERASLLGYPNHAAYQLEDESAGNPAAVRDMISQVAPSALARARAEAAEIQKLIDAQAAASGTPSFALQPWDWSFYSQQVRKARYDFDQARVAPYFELDRVLEDGVFYAAHQLYGLSFDEVTTMFHEFGHALHGMLSSVRYPKLSGTAVPRDFVEYPSQYNEMWAREPEVVAHYARHHQTGEPMPPELLEKVLAAQKFNQGYATTEYLAAALLDQA